ncbi:hypothetical protein G5T42_04610 [Microbacterium sp. 4R-513]|uniref:hypothetical protein n=1 Tax=Microbacterium sp. 4R-513 TaxID=2567934 RepID=UPI0013E13EC6|nr:hypothetical protein [Microbacterium sp. 4R-513]QIG38854.1 hypothetical protein G5T42_04610 [Microbacterium sp. 4R-513]
MGREPAGGPGEDDRADEHVVDEEWEAGALRRSPRYGRILLSSVFAGLAVAGIHTALSSAGAGPGDPLASQASGIMWTYCVLAVIWVAFGLLVAATVVIALDRSVGRHSRPVITEHSTIITDDLRSPMTDEAPWWLREPGDEGDDEPVPRRPER